MSRVDFNKVCKDYSIHVDTLAQVEALNDFKFPEGSTGFAVVKDGKSVIFYDDTLPTYEQRYVVAHELGHILLGHLSHRNQALTTNPDWCETEANIFAAVLMANDIICQYGTS